MFDSADELLSHVEMNVDCSAAALDKTTCSIAEILAANQLTIDDFEDHLRRFPGYDIRSNVLMDWVLENQPLLDMVEKCCGTSVGDKRARDDPETLSLKKTKSNDAAAATTTTTTSPTTTTTDDDAAAAMGETASDAAILDETTPADEGDLALDCDAILQELISMFVTKNGRQPTDDEVKQWITQMQDLS